MKLPKPRRQKLKKLPKLLNNRFHQEDKKNAPMKIGAFFVVIQDDMQDKELLFFAEVIMNMNVISAYSNVNASMADCTSFADCLATVSSTETMLLLRSLKALLTLLKVSPQRKK